MRRDAILTGTVITGSIWHSRGDQSAESACKASVKGVTEERPLDLDLETHERWMRLALKQAEAAAQAGEVPVGAVLIADGEVLAEAHNRPISAQDPTAHAEIIAITAASNTINDWRLNDCSIYVTKEPCPMCAGAIINSRLKHLIFGAYDDKKGCCGSLYQLCGDKRLDSITSVKGGVLEDECSMILKEFFSSKRD